MLFSNVIRKKKIKTYCLGCRHYSHQRISFPVVISNRGNDWRSKPDPRAKQGSPIPLPFDDILSARGMTTALAQQRNDARAILGRRRARHEGCRHRRDADRLQQRHLARLGCDHINALYKFTITTRDRMPAVACDWLDW